MNDIAEASREIYWNISGVWMMYLLFAVALAIFAHGTYRRIRSWREGKPDAERLADWGTRLGIMLREVVLQRRVCGSLVPGLYHGFIFYSFIVLVMATTAVFVHADFGLPIFKGWLYALLTAGADLGGVLVLLGAAIALWRRVVSKPVALVSGGADWVALGFLALLMVTGFLVEGLRIAAIGDRWAWLSPVGWGTSLLFAGLTPSANATAHKVVWWAHTVLAMGWIASIPYTKFFHLLALPTNVFFSKLRPRGELQRVDIAALMESETFDEENFSLGLASVSDFTWKERLDFDSCVSCGRCEEACPASMVGSVLSPKAFIERNRDLVQGLIPAASTGEGPSGESGAGKDAKPAPGPGRLIVGEAIDEAVVWHCRTCGACVEVCPAAIDHVDAILEVRRNEVMIQGRVPQDAARALQLLENSGNPFGPANVRSEFIEQQGVRVVRPGEEVDVLYWIGCCTTFDPAKQKIASDIFRLLGARGIDFGVLGDDERCCGDPARLLGEERLFQEIAKAHVEALNSRKFGSILVNCPHCYNVLANEYPQFGGHYRVVHHTEFLREALSSGALRPGPGRRSRVVYHDPCYLSRYQGVVDAPRQVLRAISCGDVVEMGRDFGARSLCCGGGGGHYWMDLDVGEERVANIRVDQAQAAGADTIVTSCPYCHQMLDDSLKSRDLAGKIRLIDLASLVAETVEDRKGRA